MAAGSTRVRYERAEKPPRTASSDRGADRHALATPTFGFGDIADGCASCMHGYRDRVSPRYCDYSMVERSRVADPEWSGALVVDERAGLDTAPGDRREKPSRSPQVGHRRG
jgi:hypothetical protein